MKIKTSWNRNVAKAFSWRLLATATTIAIAFLITGKIDTAIEIGFIEFFLKIIIFSIHERAWNNIKFGIQLDENAP